MNHILPLLACLVLAGCAHSGERLDRVAITDRARADPWESTNRSLFEFNNTADRLVLSPLTDGYRFVVPEAARRGIRNAYDTMQEPQYFVNAVAQGKIKSAFRALDRFLVNTVLGLGVADHATAMGLHQEKHDFGQTMAVWNVPSGPYLMMPFFGPSTARDGIGVVVDFIFDPIDLAKNELLSSEERLYSLGVRVIDIRSGLKDQGEQFLQGSADPYATVRSAWLQLRRFEIFDGNLPPEEDFDEDDLVYPESTPAPPAQAEASAETGPPQDASLAQTPEPQP